jgi:dUTP pyrophosphatase
LKIFVQKIEPEANIPQRASNGAVGYDCFALRILHPDSKELLKELPYELLPDEMILIGTGVMMIVPAQIQCEIRPRSGLALKHKITLANSPGTLDPDYRGELGVVLLNRGKDSFIVEKGMRIAQLIFSEVQLPVMEVVKSLPESIRGGGGFGSTGLMEITEGTEELERQIQEQDLYYMRIVISTSFRSNCVRGCKRNASGQFERDDKGHLIGQARRFGCVIVKNDNVVSLGYNAQAPGQPLCSQVGCLRETENIPSGTKIERCRAIHAEWMAIIKMLKSGVGSSTQNATMYVNAEPCEICAKIIAGLGISDLVVLDGSYPQNGIEVVKAAGINVRFVKANDL